jgi:hypothetical protein
MREKERGRIVNLACLHCETWLCKEREEREKRRTERTTRLMLAKERLLSCYLLYPGLAAAFNCNFFLSEALVFVSFDFVGFFSFQGWVLVWVDDGGGGGVLIPLVEFEVWMRRRISVRVGDGSGMEESGI